MALTKGGKRGGHWVELVMAKDTRKGTEGVEVCCPGNSLKKQLGKGDDGRRLYFAET